MCVAMADTGAHGCIIDEQSAAAIWLDVTPATNGNFGSYPSPGYGPKPYAGIVHGPVDLRFSREAVMQVPFVLVIQSEKPRIIVGVDLLCGGRDISR